MNSTVLVVLIVLALLVMWFLFRMSRNKRTIKDVISQICEAEGVPDIPFDPPTAVRQVLSGTRANLPRDGQWWVANGVEMIGNSGLTRLIEETTLPNRVAVHEYIEDFFAPHAGPAISPPHLAEGRFVGNMMGQPGDVIQARTTGRLRPIGAWVVAVPPGLIDSKRR